ncbi:hypothetical protein [Streptomyces sp. NRRL S-87]|uniref:hypothetical protein n=1 Tax=Streptomyces sp. NRRL S-87 TaxID=1463920 RepID=UPI0004BF234B|nr:hypothetical protein [Streptomyces sp. NRRL S-87]
MQSELLIALVGAGSGIIGAGLGMLGGLRQAHAAQAAAERTTHAAHTQWRSSTRRDAAVSFVAAAHEALEAARHTCTQGADRDLTAPNAARRELRKALALVQLEGPDNVAEIAEKIQNDVDSTVLLVTSRHRRFLPKLLLRAAAERGVEEAQAVRREMDRVGPRPIDGALWRALRQTDELTAREVGMLARQHSKRLQDEARSLNAGPATPLEPEGEQEPDPRQRPFAESYQDHRKALREFSAAVRDSLDVPGGAAPAPVGPAEERARELRAVS